MGRILVTHELPQTGLGPLAHEGHEIIQTPGNPMSHEALMAAAGDADAILSLLVDTIGADVLEAGARGRLAVVANVAVGYDNIDVGAAQRLGITVCNTPGVLDHAVADLTFFLIIAAARRTSDAEADLRNGRWNSWSFSDNLGKDVYGSVLGLVGYGRIAREVARRAQGFGIEVLHHARTNTGLPGYVGTLEELLAMADIVSLHVPLTDATYHLIGRAQLNAMKPDAVLVNTARGGVLDEDALADALESGHLFAAGLDVYTSEPLANRRILDAPRTVLLPHIGSATTGTRIAMVRLAAQATADVLAGRMPASGLVVTGDRTPLRAE
jgi:glyoxylate reductase